jgi:protein-S-isoprenylcysteine O-methyltransferase Ste14
MAVYNVLIAASWLVFIVYWAIMAVGAKKSIGARSWRKEMGVRVTIVLLLMLALRIPAFRHAVRDARVFADNTGMLMGMVGAVICAAGIGFAIWARVYLGRNWGMPMSRREDPELVTSGPYAYVRHPIYTGIIFGMLGSALGENAFWALPLILFGSYFVYSARQEEKLMLQQFPEQYGAYMRRTKMLLPFLY